MTCTRKVVVDGRTVVVEHLRFVPFLPIEAVEAIRRAAGRHDASTGR